jgi:hypothetical protein
LGGRHRFEVGRAVEDSRVAVDGVEQGELRVSVQLRHLLRSQVFAVLVLSDDGLDRVGRLGELPIVVAEKLVSDDEIETEPESGQDEREDEGVPHGSAFREMSSEALSLGLLQDVPGTADRLNELHIGPWSTFFRR